MRHRNRPLNNLNIVTIHLFVLNRDLAPGLYKRSTYERSRNYRVVKLRYRFANGT